MNDETKDGGLVNNVKKMKTADYIMIGIFAALIAICSQIAIPATVPFTLQTFAVFLSVGLLGGKRGSLSVAVYLLLGAIGLPVLAGFTGGIAHFVGPTGGYLVGFMVSALLMWATESLLGTSLKALALSMALALLCCYAFGTIWFVIVYAKTAEPMSIGAALMMCVIPYIIPDLIKIALALYLTMRLRPVIRTYSNS